ncbi:MAG: alpha/beta fold hydrolase [Woeseia sp.]
MLMETRTAFDLATMMGPLIGAQLAPRPDFAGPLVIVAPGFGAGDASTLPLRHYLHRQGFDVEGWGLGTNLAGVDMPHRPEDLDASWEFEPRGTYRGEGSVPYLCDRFKERVQQRFAASGQDIVLIGWSLGGYLAREVARDLPDVVVRVITMGSPTIGGPKYTAAARFFRRKGMDLDWIEEGISNRESRPIRQPITAIYSKSDAVVSWQAAIDHHSADVNHIEVDAAHLGMGFNSAIWSHVVAALNLAVNPLKTKQK